MLNLEKDYSINGSTVLWLDTETTGLDEYRNDMITACFLAENNKEIKSSFEMFVKPFTLANATKEAEAVHGYSEVDMMEFDNPEEVFQNKFLPYLKSEWNGKKYILAGHNVAFDRRHLSGYWGKCKSRINGINYYSADMLHELSSIGAWFSENMLDSMVMAKFCQKNKLTNFINEKTGRKSVKLEVICQDFNIEYNSHEAVDDIIATKVITTRLWHRIKANELALDKFKKEHPFMYNMMNSNIIGEL